MTETTVNYAKHINANDEVINWIETTLKAYFSKFLPNLLDHNYCPIEHIIDYLVSPSAPKRLRKMSFKDAERKAEEWSKASQKKGKNLKDQDDDVETVHDFLDGTKIVKLKSKKAFQREGFLMSHCVGGYSTTDEDLLIYSYRDSKNMPHATFEVRKNNNEIVQIKGKGNGSIHPKYIHPILAFLEVIGMKIRPNDMQNLGYYHIDDEHIAFIKKFLGEDQITMISGKAYAR